ncbi:hypothetical protein SALBM217S_03157 [Streptomyces griseoloalbus]
MYAKGDFELIVVPGRDSAQQFGGDPMAYQRDAERELQPYRDSSWATSTGLKTIEVGGRVMAEGQFTWTGDRGELYVRNLAALIDGRYHVLQVRGPDGERDEVTRLYSRRPPRTGTLADHRPTGGGGATRGRDKPSQCGLSGTPSVPRTGRGTYPTLSRPLRGNVNQMQGSLVAGRYRLGDSIGSGGMGRVWRAHDEVLHRSVAIKELTAALYVSDSGQATLLARTRAEARAAGGLRAAHAGRVVRCTRGPASSPPTCCWERDGRVLLTDFGIAQMRRRGHARTGEVVAVRRVPAPERVGGAARARVGPVGAGARCCARRSAAQLAVHAGAA